MTKLNKHDLNRLAECASYGEISSLHAYPHSGRGGAVSKSQLRAERAWIARANRLAELGLVTKSECCGIVEIEPTEAGLTALRDAGYVRNDCGYYLIPGAPEPSWSF
jgi:hypothetical protein